MKRSTSKRNGGVSKKSIIHVNHPGQRESIILTSGKQDERKAEAQKKRRIAIQREWHVISDRSTCLNSFFRTK